LDRAVDELPADVADEAEDRFDAAFLNRPDHRPSLN
jgi:hypothetical protein